MSQRKETPPQEPQREGVGWEMGYSISKPEDATDWRPCPDCKVWVHGIDRPHCPNCGYVFDQSGSPAK